MLTPRDLLLGLGLPFLFSVALLAHLRRRATDSSSYDRAVDLAPLGLLLGYLFAHAALFGGTPLPPVEAVHWLYCAAVLMLVVGVVDQFPAGAAWFRCAASFAALEAAAWFIVRPMIANSWAPAVSAVWLIGLTAALIVQLVGLDRLFARQPGPAPAISIGIVSTLTAAVILMSGSQTYGQLAGTIPVALGPFIVWSTWRRVTILAPPLAGPFVLLYDGLLLCAYLFASLTATNAILLSLAPLCLWAGELARVRTLPAWQRAAVQFAAATLPAAIAFALALRAFLHDMSAPGGYGY